MSFYDVLNSVMSRRNWSMSSSDIMPVSVKVYYGRTSGTANEIRRFVFRPEQFLSSSSNKTSTISSQSTTGISNSSTAIMCNSSSSPSSNQNGSVYTALTDHICTLFQGLNVHDVHFCWKDDDGDYVVFSSDDELKVAISSTTDNTLRIYIRERESFVKKSTTASCVTAIDSQMSSTFSNLHHLDQGQVGSHHRPYSTMANKLNSIEDVKKLSMCSTTAPNSKFSLAKCLNNGGQLSQQQQQQQHRYGHRSRDRNQSYCSSSKISTSSYNLIGRQNHHQHPQNKLSGENDAVIINNSTNNNQEEDEEDDDEIYDIINNSQDQQHGKPPRRHHNHHHRQQKQSLTSQAIIDSLSLLDNNNSPTTPNSIAEDAVVNNGSSPTNSSATLCMDTVAANGGNALTVDTNNAKNCQTSQLPNSMISPRITSTSVESTRPSSGATVSGPCKACSGGTRRNVWYKCTICLDYVICVDCENQGLHDNHPMLRVIESTP